jgi:hypothetical protein
MNLHRPHREDGTPSVVGPNAHREQAEPVPAAPIIHSRKLHLGVRCERRFVDAAHKLDAHRALSRVPREARVVRLTGCEERCLARRLVLILDQLIGPPVHIAVRTCVTPQVCRGCVDRIEPRCDLRRLAQALPLSSKCPARLAAPRASNLDSGLSLRRVLAHLRSNALLPRLPEHLRKAELGSLRRLLKRYDRRACPVLRPQGSAPTTFDLDERVAVTRRREHLLPHQLGVLCRPSEPISIYEVHRSSLLRVVVSKAPRCRWV